MSDKLKGDWCWFELLCSFPTGERRILVEALRVGPWRVHRASLRVRSEPLLATYWTVSHACGLGLWKFIGRDAPFAMARAIAAALRDAPTLAGVTDERPDASLGGEVERIVRTFIGIDASAVSA